MKYLVLIAFFTLSATGHTELLENREKAIVNQVLCPACQGQSIADSASPVAVKMRQEVHILLKQGSTDQQVYDYLSKSYGQEVLLNPVFGYHTLILWLIPFLLIVYIIFTMFRKIRFL